MQGFLYKLFVEKWKLYRILHFSRLFVELAVVALLAVVVLMLKMRNVDRPEMAPMLIAMLTLMGLLMIEELRIMLLWVRDNSQTDDLRDRIPLARALGGWRP